MINYELVKYINPLPADAGLAKYPCILFTFRDALNVVINILNIFL